jgi:hypothetical protein
MRRRGHTHIFCLDQGTDGRQQHMKIYVPSSLREYDSGDGIGNPLRLPIDSSCVITCNAQDLSAAMIS